MIGTEVARRLAATVTMVVAAALLATPAQAATLAPTHLHLVVSPTTAKVGSVVTLTGTVTPRAADKVDVQRLVGKKWQTIAHLTPTRKGAFALRLRAPKKPVTWVLRLHRAATSKTRAAATGAVHVHIVKQSFVLTAQPNFPILPEGGTLSVTGSVLPAAAGPVRLERLLGGQWLPFATGAMTSPTTYAVATVVTAGTYTLRAAKSLSKAVAAGSGPPFTLTVLPNPVITTTSLPKMIVGVRYSAPLTAAQGTPPYVWSVSSGSLPSGLTLTPAGVISGRPLVVGPVTASVRVADAYGFTGALRIDFTVAPVATRAWGANGYGELGTGTTTAAHTPVFAGAGDSVQSIAAGLSYALALRTDGAVLSWGLNDNGQLGVGGATPTSTPTQIPGLTGIVWLAAGNTSAYAVRSDGTLWAWGANGSGELGNGTTMPSAVPEQVPGLDHVTAVAAADRFVLALKSDGTVWAWGRGADGQLGDNTTTPQQETPVQVSGITTATAISAGSGNGYAVLADGTVRSWGRAEHGALGNGQETTAALVPVVVSGLTGVTSVAGNGFEFALALRGDGTVSGWGYGASGNLGDNSLADVVTPVTVPVSGVTAIATGEHSSYALTNQGTVLDWGANGGYELGNGITTESLVPAAIPGLGGVLAIAAGSTAGYVVLSG